MEFPTSRGSDAEIAWLGQTLHDSLTAKGRLEDACLVYHNKEGSNSNFNPGLLWSVVLALGTMCYQI